MEWEIQPSFLESEKYLQLKLFKIYEQLVLWAKGYNIMHFKHALNIVLFSDVNTNTLPFSKVLKKCVHLHESHMESNVPTIKIKIQSYYFSCMSMNELF